MSTKDEPAELDQDVARREKYRKLREAGVPLFPYTAARTHEVGEIVAAFAGLTAAELEEKKPAVVVPGRIMSIRRMGKATFFHISDGRRQLQAYIRADKVGAEAYERFALFDLGDVVSVSGTLFKTRTGELTVLCDAVTFLAKCLHPLPEKWHGLQDVELRYRQRYLDLIMNPEVGEVFRLRERHRRLHPAVLRRPRLPRGRDADDAPHPRRRPGPAVQDLPQRPRASTSTSASPRSSISSA